MILPNRQAQYKYSSNGMQLKQEKSQMTKNIKKGRFSFIIRAMKISFVALVIGVVVILYVHQYVQISVANYQIENLQKQLNDLEMRNDNIHLRIAENKSLKKVEEEAREKLGLVEPGPQDIYYISKGKETIKKAKPVEVATEEKKIAFLGEVGAWFKNLTSVEAGTLDE